MNYSDILEKLRGDYTYFAEILPGLERTSPGEFFFLALLLSRNIFEVILPKAQGEPWRIVYMMNDAAESFIVLEDAFMTGTYLEDYKGEVTAGLDRNARGWVLAVHQGREAAPVFFFTGIHMETHLYDYGTIAHFWIRGAENLRQLQYKAGIVRDKLVYLGRESCTETEAGLASLVEFPPLSYLFYPSAPPRYTRERETPWEVSPQAADFMERAAQQAGDRGYAALVRAYAAHPSRRMAGRLADLLKRTRHKAVPDTLTRMFEEEGARYGRRSYPEPEERQYEALLERAAAEAEKLRDPGLQVYVVREEPFAAAVDEVRFHAYLMILQDGLVYRKVRIRSVGPSEPEKTAEEISGDPAS